MWRTQMADSNLVTQKQEIFDYVHAFLGGGMVDVELDPIHYETALTKALTQYRMRSDHSVEEAYVTLNLIEDQNDYTLPHEIMEVNKVYRRSVGSRSAGEGSTHDPFNLAYTNAYLLAGSGMGGLATYELFTQRQELIGRMFGAFIEFTWNNTTKKLTILQRPRGGEDGEDVLLEVYMYRPDSQLLNDYMAKQWIKDYTLAACKYMLGEAREKFATIAGPQGGTSLNGASLKAEAQTEMEKLIAEVSLAVPGGTGYGFTIG
jgi:hypothetical protein